MIKHMYNRAPPSEGYAKIRWRFSNDKYEYVESYHTAWFEQMTQVSKESFTEHVQQR